MKNNIKTRKELAKLLNVTVKTLSNWEKDKPELIRLVNLGLQTESYMTDLECLVEKMKTIKDDAENQKIIINK